MTFFDEHCHGSREAGLPSQHLSKRVRERRFVAFGERLKRWRAGMPVERVVHRVRALGVPFAEATLRSWEYGWTEKPDPMRLLALATVYKVSAAEALDALRESRENVSGTRINTQPMNTPTDDAVTGTPGRRPHRAVPSSRKEFEAGAFLDKIDNAERRYSVGVELIEAAQRADELAAQLRAIIDVGGDPVQPAADPDPEPGQTPRDRDRPKRRRG